MVRSLAATLPGQRTSHAMQPRRRRALTGGAGCAAGLLVDVSDLKGAASTHADALRRHGLLLGDSADLADKVAVLQSKARAAACAGCCFSACLGFFV